MDLDLKSVGQKKEKKELKTKLVVMSLAGSRLLPFTLPGLNEKGSR